MGDVQTEKLHAACDECRTRKLKCSGAMPACARCERESMKCQYSPQKPMGRPRKRRREVVPAEQTSETHSQHCGTPNEFPVPTFGEIGELPHPLILDDFSGFAEFPPDDGLGGRFLLSSYPEPILDGFGQQSNQALNFNIDPVDPSLWTLQPTHPTPSDPGLDSSSTSTPSQSDTGPCTCLSIMYLTISDLQTITSFAFPAVIPRLRRAMAAASSMVHCTKCPRDTFNATQNVQALTSLLSALAERFHKVLEEIDAEAARKAAAGEKKPFRVGDNSRENAHLHTGTTDCPMGFDLELEPHDWRRLAKQAMRGEVMGGGSNSTPLVLLLDELEKRQKRWHSDKSIHTQERARIFGVQNQDCTSTGEAALCLRMVHQVRRMLRQMNWE